jgi:hypothetical protein
MDKDEAAAFWAAAHADSGGSDLSGEAAKLEATVYSRTGNEKRVLDFNDPVTGETVWATPSQLRPRVLRARQSAGFETRDSSGVLPATESAGRNDGEAEPLIPAGPPRRRFVLPLVAAAAFAAGIALTLVVTTIPVPVDADITPDASASATLPRHFPDRFFDRPSISEYSSEPPGSL